MAEKRTRKTQEKPSLEVGVALIVALVVLAILVVITLQFTYTTTIDLKLVRNQSRELKSYYAARGVVALAKARILDDLIQDGGLFAPDSFQDGWAAGEGAGGNDDAETPESSADGVFRTSIGDVAIEYRIVDEDSKICLNNLALEELHLPAPGEAESPRDVPPPPPGGEAGEKKPPPDPKALAKERREMTREFIRGILVELYVDEAEAEDLAVAMEERAPYSCLTELLSIEGITEDLLLGHSDEFGPRPGLVDFLTVHSMGEVNINTAPREVLVAILSSRYGTEASYYAEKILEFRDGAEEQPADDETEGDETGEDDDPPPTGGVFGSVDELPTKVPEVGDVFGGTGEPEDDPNANQGERLKRQLTVWSRFFSVRVTAGETSPRKEYRFVLKRGLTPEVPIPVLLWEEQELPPAPTADTAVR